MMGIVLCFVAPKSLIVRIYMLRNHSLLTTVTFCTLCLCVTSSPLGFVNSSPLGFIASNGFGE